MNNIIVTAINSLYFESVLTLISSIHKYSLSSISKIVIYNLGLIDEEIKKLNRLELVEVKEFSVECKTYFNGYLEPKSHAYKPFCLYDVRQRNQNVLWLDAGVMILQDIQEIFDIIDSEHIFLVGDLHLNKNFTSPDCVKIMNATENELNDVQLSSGILGYKAGGKFQHIIDMAFEFSKIPNCIPGHENNHRHDQSVYSILASRYNCKKYDINRYGYWTDLYRNLHTAIQANAVIFVHRRGHYDMSNLVWKHV